MKRLFIVLALVFTCQMAFCQVDDKVYAFDEVEVKPSFPEGDSAMYEWIAKNFQYPYSETCVSGTIFVQFVIEKNGSISDIQILRSFDPEFAKEVIRVVSIMPKWEPGRNKEKKVRVSYILPVKFKLT